MLGSFFIAISMYSKIPVPQIQWNDKNTRFVICFFPFVGVILGGLTILLWVGMECLSLHMITETAFLLALPLLITGGIHLDGFVDVSDALHSYGTKEKKLEILKDPHIGAFAVIRLAFIGLLYLGGTMQIVANAKKQTLCYQIPVGLLLFALGYLLSRGLSGMAAVTFPNAKKEGTLYTFTKETDSKLFPFLLSIWIILAMMGILWVGHWIGLIILTVQGFLFFHYFRKSQKEFGGITGDLEGWFLVRSELLTALLVGILTTIL